MAIMCLTVVLGLTCQGFAAKAGRTAKQFVELRHYTFADVQQKKVMIDFLAKVAIPAWNRMDISPVGVFQMADGKTTDLYVVLPHASLRSVARANTRFLADKKVQQDGDVVWGSPMKKPVYKRIESSLLLGFDKCPKVEVPTKKDTRVFQLRIYESHNETKAKRKIEMFNKGEIETFRATGLDPVFFGEALVGGKIPNLTYMVGFDDAEAQKAAWGAFGKHPKWIEMRSDPYYADTVSNITNLVLTPADGSQI
ncbi:MAG: NIPSNAP family containing protein [Planctomycetes bacterium]|nr:NIPSNAP family containing protein [Planctomycetota bacterium]